MAQHYSDPRRANDAHALPDVETFYIGITDDCPFCPNRKRERREHTMQHRGWYWQSCFPGCLPDSEPNGPFATEDEALADARESACDDDPDGDDDDEGGLKS